MSKEQIFTHNQVKGEFAVVLGGLVKSNRLGRFFHDRVSLINPLVPLSTQPDGTFVSWETLRSGQVRLVEGAEEGFVELEGTRDMTLEVVSPGSVKKDTVTLHDLYWQAGISEYWLVDARRDSLRFDILRHTTKGYVATRKQAGWVKSAVFGKSFRLDTGSDPLGYPEYTLSIR